MSESQPHPVSDTHEHPASYTQGQLPGTQSQLHTASSGKPAPQVTVEPGRSLAGPATTPLCRVVAVRRSGDRPLVEVDAGANGFASSAHQRATRSVHLLSRLSPAPDVHVEILATGLRGANGTGGVVVHDTLLPADIAEGDLLAVPSTGNAHHSAIAHRLPRPPVVAVADNRGWSLVERRCAGDAQPLRRAG